MRHGKITLLDEEGNELVQPRAHGTITASLTDPDGGVTGVPTWQWERSQVDPPTTSNDLAVIDGRHQRHLHADQRRHELLPEGYGDLHGREE